MTHKSLTVATAVLLLTITLLPARADQGRSNPVPLAVSVFNEAELSVSAVERAETRAGLVLAAAGMEVTWVQCIPVPSGQIRLATPSSCATLAYPAHLSVRILLQGDGQKEHACGSSWLDEAGTGVRAAVFYSCVAASAKGYLDEEELLGCVIAHEIGHLLLGPHAHSPAGLMRAHWGPNELREAASGNLYFSSEQEARLHSRLDFFTRAATASPQDTSRIASGK